MEQYGLVAVVDEVRRHHDRQIARRCAGNDQLAEVMGLEEVAPLGVVECGVVFVDQHAVNDELSGRRDSNSRLLGPKPSALPGCATPRAADGAEHVAVRAHKLALLQLCEDECTAPTPNQTTDRRELLVSR